MRKKSFDLQLFAEDEDADKTPTDEETVENEPTQNDDVENDEETPEFDDTDDEENTSKEDEDADVKKKNTNKENAQRRIAEKRRKEQEKKAREEAERKSLERQAYLKGIKRALGDTNPYTDKPIVDEEDLEEYEIMKKLEDEGKNPVEDYAEYIKEQKREAKKQELANKQEEENRQKFVREGIEEVDKKYGEGTADKYLKDERFMKMFSSALNHKVPLVETIENYMEIEKEINDRAIEKAAEKEARRRASAGGMNSDTPQSKSFKNMSEKEKKAYLDDLMNTY